MLLFLPSSVAALAAVGCRLGAAAHSIDQGDPNDWSYPLNPYTSSFTPRHFSSSHHRESTSHEDHHFKHTSQSRESHQSSGSSSNARQTADSVADTMEDILSIVDPRFIVDQFSSVNITGIFNDIKGDKVLTFLLTKDILGYLMVNFMWLVVHNVFWTGKRTPPQKRVDIVGNRSPVPTEKVDEANERIGGVLFREPVDVDVITNFYMNPQIVARNMMIVSTTTMFALFFWFLPSVFWRFTDLAREQRTNQLTPGAAMAPTNITIGQPADIMSGQIAATPAPEPKKDSKFLGIIGSYMNVGIDDVYNRVLCPACVAQIMVGNTLVLVAQLFCWTIMPQVVRFLGF